MVAIGASQPGKGIVMRGTQDRAMSALPPIPASKYLIDDRPLVVKLQLVRLIGFKAAIVLQQVRYWLGEDRRPQVRDGHPWVYNTYPDWQKQFPFWPVSTIKETFLELEREGLLLSGHFNARNTDRTKWYTIPPNVIRDLDRRAQADAVPQARRRGARREDGTLPALPESSLLIDRDTLIILPRLAARIGLNEAIVLQQVFYWLGGDRKPHVRDGRRWVYNTYEGWREQFPFLSERTIRRMIRELEQEGLLESAFFADHPEHRHLDHTKWYTINFDRLAALQSADPIAACVPPQGTGSVPLEADKRHHSTITIAAVGNGQKSTTGRAITSTTKRPESDIGSGHDATLNMASNGQWNRPEAPIQWRLLAGWPGQKPPLNRPKSAILLLQRLVQRSQHKGHSNNNRSSEQVKQSKGREMLLLLAIPKLLWSQVSSSAASPRPPRANW